MPMTPMPPYGIGRAVEPLANMPAGRAARQQEFDPSAIVVSADRAPAGSYRARHRLIISGRGRPADRRYRRQPSTVEAAVGTSPWFCDDRLCGSAPPARALRRCAADSVAWI